MTVRQLPFEWPHRDPRPRVDVVPIDTTMIESLVALMARAMIAIVRGVDPTQEDADER